MQELCEGGELFDRIIAKVRYSEHEASRIFKTMLEVVKHCHDMGVMHRDLKPENFLMATTAPDSEVGWHMWAVPAREVRGARGQTSCLMCAAGCVTGEVHRLRPFGLLHTQPGLQGDCRLRLLRRARGAS